MGRTRRNDGRPLDPVRRRLLSLVAESRLNLRAALLAIGRNAAYPHQFINRRTPRVMVEYAKPWPSTWDAVPTCSSTYSLLPPVSLWCSKVYGRVAPGAVPPYPIASKSAPPWTGVNGGAVLRK